MKNSPTPTTSGFKNIFLFFTFLAFSISNVLATNYYQRQTGNWNSAATWTTSSAWAATTNTGTYPKAGDNVYIANNSNLATITLTGNETCANLTFSGSEPACVIAMGNYNLIVSGAWTTNWSCHATITQNTGYLQINGAISTFNTPETIKNLRVGSTSFSMVGFYNLTVSTNYDFNCLQSTIPSGINSSTAAKFNISAATASANGVLVCIGSSTILSASGAVAGDKYKWYNAATGGTLLKTSADNNDNTYTTPVLSATTNYWVSILSAGGCESSRTQVTATFPSVSTDNQNATGNNSWIGHVYDGVNFNTYYGSYTEPETFDQSFGGGTNCFGINSNSVARSIYTETFSVRYRMNSTKKGLYIVNLGSDDGTRLTVDGTVVCNNWSDQGFTLRSIVLMSLTGSSALNYEFYENAVDNRVVFQNLTLVLANTLSNNTSQVIIQGSTGTTISGDTYGTLPTGISLSGTGYQWTYSTTPGGTRNIISGATGATFTPTASTTPFNVAGTYYIYRNAVLSSVNNVAPNPYVATNESNAAILTVNAPTAPTTTGGLVCIGSTATLSASGAVAGDTYKWYNAATGGTLLKTSTDNNDNTYTTTALSVTSNYWVSIVNSGGYESSRTQVTATFPSVSTDDQNAAGNNSWIGHVYDNINFNTYYGSYTEPEMFDQSFGGTQNCFGFTSNSVARSIYTETFSVHYRMNSTKKGLYVVNLGSDDGTRLTVDGTLVCNNWTAQSFTSRPRVLMSLTGSSSLVYDFYEQGGSNRVVFNTLTLVLANTLSSNTTQEFCQGSNGTTISGDTYGTLPTGVTLSGTGYQWTYSTSPGGIRTAIVGATGATFTPSASIAPFNAAGTYYIYRNAVLSSVNNVNPNPYVATNESNAAVIIVNPLPTQPISISGNINPYQDSTEIYSITNVSGETYTWTLPGDWTKTAGGSTNSLTVKVGLNVGNVQVIANNSCGSSAPTTLAVTVLASIDVYPDTIVWTDRAKDGDWDNYANWVNPSTRKQLNSKAKFKNDLTVVFPSPETIKHFESELGIMDSSINIVDYPAKKTPTKIKINDNFYMKNIKIEYGASLKIGNLLNKYTTAEVELEIADRNEWILVGPSISPVDGGTERSIMSGDYYLNGTPQVYMNEMYLNDCNEASWSTPFPSLDKVLSADKCFAIRIPDQYGKYKVSGSYYYRKDPTKSPTIGKDPVKYTFKGKFQNEITTPTISTVSGKFVVACNTFMANISAKKFLDIFGGQISVWSFNETSNGTAQMGSFTAYNATTVPTDLYIKPMQAFMYLDENATNRVITLNEDDICDINASTKYKAKAPVSNNPTLQIIASNGGYSSKTSIVYDENLSDGGFNFSKDIVKLFSGYAQTPEMFSYLGNYRLQSQTINNFDEVVNLGIKIGVSDTIKLCIIGVDQFEAVFLADKLTNTTYKLSGDTAKIDFEVLAGTNSDRFYVKFEPAPGVVTKVHENTNEAALKIYTEDNQHVIVSNAEYTQVNNISIVDMSGHVTTIIPTSDSYNVIDMSNYPAGVYAVKAVTGTDAKTEKIAIK